MASKSYGTAALVLVGAVALQQYSRWRAKQVTTNKKPTKAAAVSPPLPLAAFETTNDAIFIVEIEYCTGCRWMLRAAWMAQELLTTFQQDASSRLRSVVLTPNSRQGGVFQVYLHATDGSVERELLWSRKLAGRFPESKELKQIVRDHIDPEKGLGHSDKK